MARSRFHLLWQRPAPPRSSEERLTRNRIHLLPTRNGLLLGLLVLAMMVGAMNYGNGLAYALAFLLASVAMVSVFHTYRNLAHLTLRAGPCRPVFAGQPAVFPIAVENPGARRYALGFEIPSGRAVTDVAERSGQWIELRQPTDERGWCQLPRVTATTTFPLGLFRAWSHLHLEQRCLVYPRPERRRRGLPPGRGQGDGEGAPRARGLDEFANLRDYRAGDSPRRIHWKALAREQGLLTKEFEGDNGRDLWLDWEQLPGLAPERRLARLCRWVLTADGQARRYGLRLPGREIALGSGPCQRYRCLEALALHGKTP